MSDGQAVGLRLLALLLGLYVLTAAGYLAQGDEETMYRLTRNLAWGRALDVGRESLVLAPQAQAISGAFDLLPSQPLVLDSTSAVPGRAGGLYSKYALGQSLLALPLFGLGTLLDGLWPRWPQLGPRLALAMLNPLVLAASGWLLFHFVRHLGYSLGVALAVSLAYSLTTMAWPYVNTFYPQPSTGLGLLLVAYAFQRWHAGCERGASWAWMMGLALGAAVLIRTTALVAVPGLGLVLPVVARTWSDRLRVAWRVGLPLVAAVSLGALYNWLRFRSPLDGGYYEAAWTTPPAAGLYGLLFSSGKGLFLYSPLLLLSFGALPLFFRRHRRLASLMLLWWVAYLAFYAPYDFWTGGFNWGPRFLLPLVPISLLPCATMLASRQVRGVGAAFALLFVVGFAIQLPAVVVDHARYLTVLRETGNQRFYDESIYLPALSPIVHQWPTALSSLQAFGRPEYRQRTGAILQQMDLPPAVTLDDRHSAQRVLQTEFIRLNLPAVWWLYLPLLGISPWLTAILALPWLGLLVWGGWGLCRKLGHGLKCKTSNY